MTDLPNTGLVQPDRWTQLRALTSARIALGRSGVSIPSRELLSFRLDHAHARDAVYSTLDINALQRGLEPLGLITPVVQSEALNREMYIQRPDKGRRLEITAATALAAQISPGKLVIVLADGLSAEAVNRHAISLINDLLPRLYDAGISTRHCVLACQGRVALGDDIGERLHAEIVLVLIGERPGLSSPDSLGAYLTYRPRVGLTDESRNCVSNIRPEGLSYHHAANKLFYLITQATYLQLSGIGLKDNDGLKK
ncbi:MAG TPA: ethanolamine ammonia-lyase subunit EutC [Chryseolinea sp.]|nr:ethanolamine ammonia-lyase subunit EutC [Chryseolinea sp.]